MEGHTAPTSHWLEDSSMGTHTGPTSHCVDRSVCSVLFMQSCVCLYTSVDVINNNVRDLWPLSSFMDGNTHMSCADSFWWGIMHSCVLMPLPPPPPPPPPLLLLEGNTSMCMCVSLIVGVILSYACADTLVVVGDVLCVACFFLLDNSAFLWLISALNQQMQDLSMLALDLEVLHQQMQDLSMFALDLEVLHQEMQDLSMLALDLECCISRCKTCQCLHLT